MLLQGGLSAADTNMARDLLDALSDEAVSKYHLDNACDEVELRFRATLRKVRGVRLNWLHRHRNVVAPRRFKHMRTMRARRSLRGGLNAVQHFTANGTKPDARKSGRKEQEQAAAGAE